MASGKKHRPGGGPTPEINVTPLVDVVLVLLIIFMVIAPQLEGGQRVEVPGIFNPDPKIKGSLEPVTVSINAAGEFFVDKTPVSLADLERTLREKHAADPKQRVMLKGDKALTYGPMRDLFRRCQEVGFPGVSLVVSDRARRTAGDEAGSAAEGGDHGL